jgi:hypothetical protein
MFPEAGRNTVADTAQVVNLRGIIDILLAATRGFLWASSITLVLLRT